MQGRPRILLELLLFGILSAGLLALFGLTGMRGDHRDASQALADAGRAAATRSTEAGSTGGALEAQTAGSAGDRPAALSSSSADSMDSTDSPTGGADARDGDKPAMSATGVGHADAIRRVGIVAGHWQYDTGAVCGDGLREVDVTLDVAQRVAVLLEARGVEAEILPEHHPDRPAPPLQNYRADALVSVHADSCDVPGASGFKVARWRDSNIPVRDDRLVECLYAHYEAATLLPRHDGSITIDMWNYYAFREIALETPAAIIELGFLLDDRAALDDLRYEMARGIAEGIACFLELP